MRSQLVVLTVFVMCVHCVAESQAAATIENPTGKYLVWGDYKIEINQYGGLGRDWPHDIVWEQYELLKRKAEANPEPPNTIRAVLLVSPTTHATAYGKN